MVRTVRFDDPAPVTGVVYAVQVAEAGLVGAVTPDRASWCVVGWLGDGTCLAA